MPAPVHEIDRDALARLPLPLAQLLRRAHNAPDARARHNNAFFLFEATIKLAASVLVAGYARAIEAGEPRNNALDKPLANLQKPSLGHWTGMLRELSRHFGRRPDAPSHPLGHLALQLEEPRRDSATILNLYRRIKNGPDAKHSGDQSCTLLALFDALTNYRNTVMGHGADRCDAFYEQEMGPLLLPAAVAVLAEGVLDILGPAGSRLVYLGEVRKLDDDRFEVGMRELLGAGAMRIEPLTLNAAQAESISPNRLAVLWRGQPIPLRLDPLLVFREAELNEEVRFLNSDRDGKQVEYLSYTSGKTERDPTTVADLNGLLERVAGHSAHAEADEAVVATAPIERDFEILSEIGRGGMGVIYLARQISLGRLVALKMLPAELSGDEVALARFNREIRALGQCDDPHIVKVLTSGKLSEGQRYYAMEYVPGADLDVVWHELTAENRQSSASSLGSATWSQAVLTACRHKRSETLDRTSSSGRAAQGVATAAKSATSTETPPLNSSSAAVDSLPQSAEAAELLAHLAPLPELPAAEQDPGGYARRVATLVRDAARALQTVHNQGIVHRDVKPANLMLTPDGTRVVLMDFGLAKGNTRTLEASRMAGLLGTLRYAAPEQLAAAQIKVGPKADVRGLGVTLFELLTRRRLFDNAADEKQLTSWILTKPVPRLRAIDPTLDPDLEAIVAATTEQSQDDRPTAQQFADYLDLYLAGSPLPIRLPGLAEVLRRWVRDHKVIVGAASAALAAIFLAVVTAFALINAAKNDAIVAEKKAVRLAAEKTILAAEKTTLAVQERAARDETEAQLYLSNIGLAESKWHACRMDQTLKLLDQCPPRLRDWEWFYRRRCCEAGFAVNRVTGLTGEAQHLALSPDGETLAVANKNVIRLYTSRPSTGQATELLGHQGDVVGLTFSPDGEYLASSAEVSGAGDKKNGETKAWKVASGKELFTVPTRAAGLGGGGLAFDGDTLILSDLDQVHIYNVSGKRLLTVPRRPLLVFSVAISPNRKVLAVGGAKAGKNGYEGGVVHLWSLETGENNQTLQANTTIVQHLVFSADGKYLAVSGFDNAVSVWDVEKGEELGRHADHTQRVVGMAFLGDLLVSAAEDKTLRVWQWKVGDRALATAATVPLLYPTAVETLVPSKNGSGLLAADAHGNVYKWTGDRQDYVAAQRHRRPVFCLAFSADSSRLASRGFGGTLKIWNTKTHQDVIALENEDAATESAAFSPDGRWLAVNVDGDGKTTANEIVIFDTRTWKVAFRTPSGSGTISQLAFRPDSQSLASVDVEAHAVTFWNFQAGENNPRLQTLPGHAGPITALAISPDGLFFATASADAAKIWDARTKDEVRTLHRNDADSFRDIGYSADGKRLACVVSRANGERLFKVYSVETGEALPSWEPQEFNFLSGAVNRSGTRMVLGASEEELKVIETKTGREVAAFPKWGRNYRALFSPDGNLLAAAANSEELLGPSSVRVFDGTPLGEAAK